MTDIVRLDYDSYPPGEDWRKQQEYPSTARSERTRAWATYKERNPPPGLEPHPWAAEGEPFRHAFVTPIGFTILDTVGVSDEVALAAAWRWHDIRHALVGKLKGDLSSWPGILDLTDSDIERHLQHAVLMSVVVGPGVA